MIYPAPALNALPLAKDGKVHVLAISSTKRLALMPYVPTLGEAGLPGALYNFWVGAFAPAKTPQPIVEQLNRQIVAALKVKSVVENINALGGVPDPMTIKEFETFIADEIAVNAEIVKASGAIAYRLAPAQPPCRAADACRAAASASGTRSYN